jgi:hypothetical protein
MSDEKTYTKKEIFWILGQALILLNDKRITVNESDRYDEESEIVKKRVSLVDYIARAVADELVEHMGETEEDVKEAIQKTEMDFDEIAYPKQGKSLGIYNDIR